MIDSAALGTLCKITSAEFCSRGTTVDIMSREMKMEQAWKSRVFPHHNEEKSCAGSSKGTAQMQLITDNIPDQ